MTKAQLQRIKTNLQEWCEERHITQEMQRKGIIANLLEEVTEYLRANNDLERIDALCDIAVFTLNTFDIKEVFVKHPFYYSDKFTHTGKILALITTLNTKQSHTEDEENKIIYSLVTLCEDYVEAMGYDFYECMQETIKEINSRVGEYNKDMGKFIKYQGAYTQEEALCLIDKECEITREDKCFWYYSMGGEIKGKIVKWYKANYGGCLKEE